MSHPQDSANESKDRVPLFGNWRNAYLVVVVFFVIDVALFYAFSRYFS
jgi:hypothetical protein